MRLPVRVGSLLPWRIPVRFKKGIKKLIRSILNFNGTQYATLSEPVVLDGDFEIEMLVFISDTGTAQVLIGDSTSTASFLAVRGTLGDILEIRFSSSKKIEITPADWLGYSKIIKIRYGRSSTTGWAEINGKLFEIDLENVQPITYNTIGMNDSGRNYMTGSVFSARIWKNGDRNTGELVTDLRFDEPDTNYQRNHAVALGAELVTNGDFSDGADYWTSGGGGAVMSVSGGRLIVEATQNEYAKAQQLFSMNVGKRYVITGNLSLDSEVVSGTAWVLVNQGTGDLVAKAITMSGEEKNQDFEFVFESISSTATVKVQTKNIIGVIASADNISIREWSGAILENTLPGDWELSTKVGNTWFSDIPISSYAPAAASVLVDGDVIEFVDAPSGAKARANFIVDSGAMYEVSYEVFDYVSGGVRFEMNSVGQAALSNGIYTQTTAATSDTYGLNFNALSGPVNLKIRNVSIKKIIQVAYE